MKVILSMERGPGAGRSFEVEPHVYRAVVRDGDMARTLVLENRSDLEAEEKARLEAHIARRTAASGRAVRPREGAFRRGSDILLNDGQVSRTHAMVFVDEAGASVVDLGSTNGTYVNAEAVTDAELHDGDVLSFGKVRFLVSVRA